MPSWEAWSSFELGAFPLLKRLEISNCPKLSGELPNYLPALESLMVSNCEMLVSSLPRAPSLRALDISNSNKVELHVFPLMVESIKVRESPMVESMIETITKIQPTCLKSLELSGCSSIKSFPGGHLLASLKTLSIYSLKNLKFPTQHKHELLETLKIHNSCDSLTSFPLITFPNLKSLTISECENMESLSISMSESPIRLGYFEIRECPNFVSFSIEGLPVPNLTRLEVYNCDKLNSLPDKMSTLLPKLEHLKIIECRGIESFRGRSMPPKLISVVIWDPCVGIKSFPNEGLLPPTLTSLHLCSFSSLETLDCNGLLHLTSLQELDIQCCPKLQNMIGERLPVSLIKLSITRCPLLAKRCRMKHSQIWPKISHIRCIDVRDTW